MYDDDDNFLTDYEVWQREDDYQRELDLAAEFEWEAELERREQLKNLYGSCPECLAPLMCGDNYSGVKCTKCPYWFCY